MCPHYNYVKRLSSAMLTIPTMEKSTHTYSARAVCRGGAGGRGGGGGGGGGHPP